jgi:thiopurine S-methyltransferase
VEAFCAENGVPARRSTVGQFDVYETDNLALLCGDFFALTPALLKTPAAVYDRAALISWTEEWRGRYVDHLTALTAPETQTLLITLEYPQAQMAGPPFAVNRDAVERLYSAHHAIQELSRQDILAEEARLRSRGVTQLSQVCYRLTRL